ncbi:MAG: hypothetical protein ACJ71O_06895, partial [Nitrososphaeraceae archaeon]
FIRTILIALVFLFATIFANFSFTVVAYQYNTRSNSSGNLYGSSLAKMIANTKNNTPFDII